MLPVAAGRPAAAEKRGGANAGHAPQRAGQPPQRSARAMRRTATLL